MSEEPPCSPEGCGLDLVSLTFRNLVKEHKDFDVDDWKRTTRINGLFYTGSEESESKDAGGQGGLLKW